MDLQQEYEEAAVFWEKVDADAKKMPGEAVQKALDQFLGTHRLCVLATACRTFTRATALEYTWHDGCFWIFSEGGQKFRALAENANVGLTVFDPDFRPGKVRAVQCEGTGGLVPYLSKTYLKAAEKIGLTLEKLDKLPAPLHLIRVRPSSFLVLDSRFRENGYGVRQHLAGQQSSEATDSSRAGLQG